MAPGLATATVERAPREQLRAPLRAAPLALVVGGKKPAPEERYPTQVVQVVPASEKGWACETVRVGPAKKAGAQFRASEQQKPAPDTLAPWNAELHAGDGCSMRF